MITNTHVPDGKNYKPFRTKAQKLVARATAVICADGAWRSSAPRSVHAVKPDLSKEGRAR